MKRLTAQYLTITEHQLAPLPNQDHLAFWEKQWQWIAPPLKALLFDRPEEEENTNAEILRTYLIVDAYRYTQVRGFFDLDLIDDIPVKCLFKGQAADEMKRVAPYLVDMTLPADADDDDGRVPSFHKYYFEKQWHKGTGIFVRSAADMAEVYQHFRKLTKVQDQQGKWYFFRFYDPNWLITLMISAQSSIEDSIVRSLWRGQDDFFIMCTAKGHYIVNANIALLGSSNHRLTESDIKALAEESWMAFINRVHHNLTSEGIEITGTELLATCNHIKDIPLIFEQSIYDYLLILLLNHQNNNELLTATRLLLDSGYSEREVLRELKQRYGRHI